MKSRAALDKLVMTETEQEEFLSRVEKDRVGTGCWHWLAGKHTQGYGAFRLGKYQCYAHRVSYRNHVGPIPEGLVIDHLCRNRGCVNPDHLEPVTSGENVRRAFTYNTHVCRNGHVRTEETTYHYTRPNGTPGINCRLCNKAAVIAYNSRKE